jgi:tyrosyl-DNA phosphodiesterase 2
MVSKSLLPSLLKKQLTYTPTPQHFYTFFSDSWQPSHCSLSDPTSSISHHEPLQSLHLITWNIDFMAPYPQARMSAALSHLQHLISSIPSTSATVILLQEMQESSRPWASDQNPNDLTQLKTAPWIQEKFHLSDVDTGSWASSYGTVTLVDRRLVVKQVARLPFVSEFGRDALFVDVGLGGGDDKVLRLCNVHLDSMAGAMRPLQWKALAQLLHPRADARLHESVAASVVAGDCNANQQRDGMEPVENGFRDAYLECGGVEGEEEGQTWGFQSLRWERWGRKRLDKICFWGDVQVSALERVGVDVKVGEERVVKELEELGELPFATDHHGLMGVFSVKDGLQTIDLADEKADS